MPLTWCCKYAPGPGLRAFDSSGGAIRGARLTLQGEWTEGDFESAISVATGYRPGFGVVSALLICPSRVPFELVSRLQADPRSSGSSICRSSTRRGSRSVSAATQCTRTCSTASHKKNLHHDKLGNLNKVIRSKTPPAILLSASTTICSFSTLAISGHQGTSSMGILLFISLTMTLISSLIFLPLMIKMFKISSR